MRLVLALLVALVVPVAADDFRVRGLVTDESGAVLPGVTIVATADDQKVLATTVTDGTGRYVLGPIAPGRVKVTFQLEGFSTVAATLTIENADLTADQRLAIAPQSETVQVVGKIPVIPPAPPPPPPAPIRARPFTFPVPDHDPESVCGPAKLEGPPQSFGTVRSRRYAANALYGAGDELIIEGGALNGVRVGRNFVVRRTYQTTWDRRDTSGEHTAGLVQIVAANLDTSIAVVIYACDEMLPGDRLAAFSAEPHHPVQAPGKPDFRRAATILFPDIGQMLGAPRRMMVIDRGAASGICAGQRVTIFRKRAGGREPEIVGEAVVVAVRNLSATIRIDRVNDAVFEGDMAAIQR
jgi:hypothetical protein